MQPRSLLQHLATFGAASLLGACGVTLEATRMRPEDLRTALAGEGIYYALPKSMIEITQTITLKVPTAGTLNSVWEACSRACENNPNFAVPPSRDDDPCAIKAPAPILRFSAPELRTRSVPDLGHVYRVDPKADLFQTLNVQFELGETGIVQSTNSQSQNMAFEIGAKLATTVLGNASAPPKAGDNTKSMARSHGDQSRACYPMEKLVANLGKSPTDRLSCTVLAEVQKCMKHVNKNLSDLTKERDGIFRSALKAKPAPAVLGQVDTYMKEKITAAKALVEERKALFQLSDGAAQDVVFKLTVMAGTPDEFANFGPTIDLSAAIANGTARIEDVSAGAANHKKKLMDAIANRTVTLDVAATAPQGPNNAAIPRAEESLKGGYRYRIPTLVPVTVSISAKDDQGNLKPVQSGTSVTLLSIAQYGPIAALTSRFVGKGGKVNVKFWPDSGGIKTVEIGADALPTSIITDSIDKIAARAKEKQAAEDKAADEAAKADPEKAALTRERDLLDLKLKIIELKKNIDAAD